MQNKTKLRLKTGNGCYLPCPTCLSQNYCQNKPKKSYVYKTYLRKFVSYACRASVITAEDENRLNIFERKVVRNIYGPVFISGTQMWERKTNEQLKQMYRKEIIRLVQFIRRA